MSPDSKASVLCPMTLVLGSCKYVSPFTGDCPEGSNPQEHERETRRQGEEEDLLLPVCWLFGQ